MLLGLKDDSKDDINFVDRVKDTSDRVMQFANSAQNIAYQIEKNVNYADSALSSGIDSEGEVKGRDAIRRPYF